MVKEEVKTVYVCPYCEREYDTWDRAMECAQDCVDIDQPDEKEIYTYTCEICGKKFDDEDEAEDCEDDHVETSDKEYEEHQRRMEMAKLYQAGTHPNQSALIGYRAVWKE